MKQCHILTAFLVLCFFQQKPGRLFLRDLLGWKEFDEIQEVRQSIKLDAHYYSLVFAANKGFSWQAVAEVVKLTGELLEETQGKSRLHLLQKKYTAMVSAVKETFGLT